MKKIKVKVKAIAKETVKIVVAEAPVVTFGAVMGMVYAASDIIFASNPVAQHVVRVANMITTSVGSMYIGDKMHQWASDYVENMFPDKLEPTIDETECDW